jgi:hypothetical protein
MHKMSQACRGQKEYGVCFLILSPEQLRFKITKKCVHKINPVRIFKCKKKQENEHDPSKPYISKDKEFTR